MMLKHPLFFPFGQPQLFFPFGRRVAVVTAQSLTNVQKLSLPANTSLGTQVAVTDGFAVSGGVEPDYPLNGFFKRVGIEYGKAWFQMLGNPLGPAEAYWSTDAGNKWFLSNVNSDVIYYSTDDVDFPWQVTTWHYFDPAFGTDPVTGLTLTHPALQQLTAPATAQGGVFVAGGSQDGVYTKYGQLNGKDAFVILGEDSGDPHTTVAWFPDSIVDILGHGPAQPGFLIQNDSGVNYYSTSPVATPDLATNWKNASDDSPASITVTSVTQGELDAGLTVTGSGTSEINKVHLKNNANNSGRPSYDQIDFSFDGLIFSQVDGNWQWAGTYSSTDTAFPWQAVYSLNGAAAPVPTVTRNNVASEANWTNI